MEDFDVDLVRVERTRRTTRRVGHGPHFSEERHHVATSFPRRFLPSLEPSLKNAQAQGRMCLVCVRCELPNVWGA